MLRRRINCVRYLGSVCTSFQGSTGSCSSSSSSAVGDLNECRRFFRERSAAHRPSGDRSHSHPLAVRDPSHRNIALPDSVHAKPGSRPTQAPDVQAKRAQRALLVQMERRVLWQGAVVNDMNHDLAKHFLKLRNDTRYRNARKRCSIQGAALITELIGRGYHPKTLLVQQDHAPPDWVDPDETEIVRVSDRVLSEVAAKGDGYIGDFDIPEPPHTAELMGGANRLTNVLVLDNVRDEGLLGTYIRSAVAFSYDAVVLTNQCADAYSHGVLRAAAGTHFQPLTKVITLRDEDGDDVHGIINHLQQRNQLTPAVYSPTFAREYCTQLLAVPTTKTTADAPVVDVEGCSTSSTAPVAEETGHQVEAVSAGRQRLVQKLHDFCLDSYRPESRTDQHTVVPGHMLIAGDDYRGNLVQRYERRLARTPTVLVADHEADLIQQHRLTHSSADPNTALEDALSVLPDTASEALEVSLPTMLYELRHSAAFDYLTETQRENGDYHEQHNLQQGRVELGSDRRDLSEEHLNLDDDDLYNLAMKELTESKQRRMGRRLASDQQYFEQHEMKRIRRMAVREGARESSPLYNSTADPSEIDAEGMTFIKREVRYPDVPHFIHDDNPEHLHDRDTLRMDRDSLDGYQTPSMYRNIDKKRRPRQD